MFLEKNLEIKNSQFSEVLGQNLSGYKNRFPRLLSKKYMGCQLSLGNKVTEIKVFKSKKVLSWESEVKSS